MSTPATSDEAAPEPRLFALNITDHPDGRGAQVGLVAKRTYRVSAGRCVVAEEQVPLVELPETNDDRSVLLHDMDTVLNRRQADIVVTGKIRALRKERRLDVHVRVGSLSRRLRAFGDRRCLRGSDGRLRFSDPDPIEEIDVGWTAAYGGVDEVARKKYGDPIEGFCKDARQPYNPRFGLFAYPRNPVGRGYLLEPTSAAFEACELPLIEDPESVLTPDSLVRKDFVCWPEGPAVAGFGWLSHAFFPRSAMLGARPLVYDGNRIPASAFHEVRRGEIHEAAVRGDRPFQERLDVGVAQASAIGMRAKAVGPGDGVALHGLHPRESRWTFRIPSEVPRMHARFVGEKTIELPAPAIRTVLIQPDEDRLTLVWTSELLLASAPGPKRLEGLQHLVVWNR